MSTYHKFEFDVHKKSLDLFFLAYSVSTLLTLEQGIYYGDVPDTWDLANLV